MVLQTIICLTLPFLLLKAKRAGKLNGFFNPVILSYLAGMLIAQLPFVRINLEVAKSLTAVSVAFAIALLLLSADFMSWLKGSRPTLISSIGSFISVMLSA